MSEATESTFFKELFEKRYGEGSYNDEFTIPATSIGSLFEAYAGGLEDRIKELEQAAENMGAGTGETTLLHTSQLQQMIALLEEYRNDLTALVSVFQSFTGLFTGKVNAFAILPVITKLLNNPKAMEQFQHIVPIIEKYTQKPESNGEEK